MSFCFSGERMNFSLSRKSKKTLLVVLVAVALLVNIAMMTVKFNITGSYEGIFLLRGELGALFELKDDVYLGEAYRYIIGMDFEPVKQLYDSIFNGRVKGPYLYYKWDEKNGEGYVKNYFSDGKQLLVNFSRFVDEFGGEASGLFVGGGLPANVHEDNSVKMNATGMAYHDGTRWYHIWCNANEALFTYRLEPRYPSSWKYLGSKVLHYSKEDLILESKHEVMIDNVPLHIDRHVFFRAGATFFVLSVNIKNVGKSAVTYYYLYGDDPWLGNYGSSGGNIGWSGDGFYYYVGRLNTKKYNYAGYFDFGNGAIGQQHNFTRTANFIEWFGDLEPFVYFSNGPSDIPPVSNERIPLSSNARFIGINWGPRTLRPGQSETYTLAIGMADHDPKTGFPVKPEVDLKNFP